jgi:hypothetical protein
MYFSLMTDPTRDWRLALFFDIRDWGFGPQVSLYGQDKWAYYRREIHIRLGPFDFQYIIQKNKR